MSTRRVTLSPHHSLVVAPIMSPPRTFFVFAVMALFIALPPCRASNIVESWRPHPGTPTAVMRANPKRTATATELSVAEAATSEPTQTLEPTQTFMPTETVEPTEILGPTWTLEPTETLEPADTPTPRITRALAPTAPKPPTATQGLVPTHIPTQCPYEYCVTFVDCKSGENTRAIGTIRVNGVPTSGLRVRVSNAYGGTAVTADFISGRDPINPDKLDPNHPGYYQVGIRDGEPIAGNWWVFIVDNSGSVISEGRVFNTQAQQTQTSCQIGITDFAK